MVTVNLLHIISDLPAFFGYVLAAIIATNIYTRGQLASSPETHPSLWRTGILFLVLSAAVKLAAISQLTIRLTTQQDFAFLTLVFKLPLSVVAVVFVYQSWQKMYELIAMGLAWRVVDDLSTELEHPPGDNNTRGKRGNS